MPEPSVTHVPVSPPRALPAAVRRLLRPLVKLLLHHSVQYPALTSLLKQTYVEMATAMPVEGKPQTDSRVSLLTGIHRLDVKRLRNEISNGDEVPPMSVSLGAQIVARWIANVEYLDNKGRPGFSTPSARQRGGADEFRVPGALGEQGHPTARGAG